MNKTIIKIFLTTVCTFISVSLLAEHGEGEYIWEITSTECELKYQYTAKKEFIERKGVQIIDNYRHYRVLEDQIIFSIGPEINNLWQISTLIGFTRLELHCSEGETRRFDTSFLFGVDTELLVALSGDQKVAIYLGGRFVTFNANDGRVTDVIQHADFVVWDSLDLQWRELTFIGRAVVNISEFTGMFGGIEYSLIDLQEDGMVYGVKRSGKLRESDRTGLFFGLEKKLNEIWSYEASINFIDKTTFTVSLTGRF